MSVKHVVLLVSLVLLLVACASPPPQARQANFFDQFDEPAAPSAAPPAVAPPPDWGAVSAYGMAVYNSAQPQPVYLPPPPRTYNTNCYDFGTDVQCRTTSY